MRRVRVGVVGVGNMGRTYAEAIGGIEGLELAALCTRTLDRIKDLPGEKFSDHRAMIGSGRVDAVVIATPHWSHPTSPSTRSGRDCTFSPTSRWPCTWQTAADARRARGQDAPVRRHLQRAHAPGDRQDSRHDRGRRARGDPPRHLARHRHLSLARVLRERGLARDLGGRGRGGHHQPGLPRSRSSPVVRGASGPGDREDRSWAVPPHRGRGRRQRAARVSERRDGPVRRDHRRDPGHEPGGDCRGPREARARHRKLDAQVPSERDVRCRVQPDDQGAVRAARSPRSTCPPRPTPAARATWSSWKTSATPFSRARRSSLRRRRRSDRWRSGTRCSCRGSSGGQSSCRSTPS